MAGSWATLQFLGEAGYRKIVQDVQDATKRLVDGINAIEGLRVLGQPDMCLFSFASDQINVFEIADEMKTKGWYLQPQLSTDLSPANLHVTVNASGAPHVDELLKDLKEAVAAVKSNPDRLDPDQVRSQIAEMMKNAGNAGPSQLMAMAGLSGAGLPARMAMLNTLMDAMPTPAVEALLKEYFNDLYR
jgi:hypothetical protein